MAVSRNIITPINIIFMFTLSSILYITTAGWSSYTKFTELHHYNKALLHYCLSYIPITYVNMHVNVFQWLCTAGKYPTLTNLTTYTVTTMMPWNRFARCNVIWFHNNRGFLFNNSYTCCCHILQMEPETAQRDSDC